MRNVTLILGAGASFNYKAPLMKDFYRVAIELFTTENNSNLIDHYKVVFSFMDLLQKSQAKANLDLHNVEQVYTALEMARMLNLESLKVKGVSWARMEESMRYFLTKTIESRVKLPISDNFYKPVRDYDEPMFLDGGSTNEDLAQAIEHVTTLKEFGWGVTIITFNYDLVIESLLATHGLEADYGLGSERLSPFTSVPLLKLHGSINWERKDRKIHAYKYFEKDKRIGSTNPMFHVDSSHNVTTSFSENIVPFVIPPVWNKSNYQSQLSNVWRRAAASLSQTSHLYAAGYSLPQTDGFFKQLYALGTVGTAPLMEFGVFDIEPKETAYGVNARFADLLGRGAENVYQYYDGGLGNLATRLFELHY